MNPSKGAIESKIYTVEGGIKKIDDITEYFLQNDGIENTEYKAIIEEKEFIQKTRFFYNFISKFERKDYNVLWDALQKFKKESNYFNRYGKSCIIEFFRDCFPLITNLFLQKCLII